MMLPMTEVGVVVDDGVGVIVGQTLPPVVGDADGFGNGNGGLTGSPHGFAGEAVGDGVGVDGGASVGSGKGST